MRCEKCALIVARRVEFEIDDDILARASECRLDFVCLKDLTSCLCKIEHNLDDAVLFVEYSQRYDCPYRMKCWGSLNVCTCPVRTAICRKYGV